MDSQTCTICLCDDVDNLIKTDCGHYYHVECIKQIIYPRCACCNNNITNLLNSIGVTNRQINQKMEAEKNRLFVNNLRLDDLTIIQKYQIICNNITLNKQSWIPLIKNIIMPYINNISYLLLKIYLFKKIFKKEGIFIYYCDLKDIIINLIHGYKKSLLQWIYKSEFGENKKLQNHFKHVYKKINKFKHPQIGVLFIIKDNINDKLIIFDEIFNLNEKMNYMTNKDIIKNLVTFENFDCDAKIKYKFNPEKKNLNDMLEYYKTETKYIKYNSFKNFIYHKINKFYTNVANIINIKGMLTLNIDNNIIILEISLDTNQQFLYTNKENKKCYTVPQLNDYLKQCLICSIDKSILVTIFLFNINSMIQKFIYCYNLYYTNNMIHSEKINDYVLENHIIHEYNEKDNENKFKKKILLNYNYFY